MTHRDPIPKLFTEPRPPYSVVCAFCSLVTAIVVLWGVMLVSLLR